MVGKNMPDIGPCATHCSDTCRRTDGRPLHGDGRCSDGWLGDEMEEGKASCALGTDCSDCGARTLCAVAGAPKLLLPKQTLSLAPAVSSLRTSEVLFMVLGSSRFRQKSERAYHSWCRQRRGISCLFFADEGANRTRSATVLRNDPIPWAIVRNVEPPRHCCARRPGTSRGNFFCTAHRANTLRAQYRYLPALHHVQRSSAVQSGRFQWVVLVDDDAFVFVSRLLWILSRLNASTPLYLGDYGSSGEASALGIPHFACGGGGSVLSLGALRRMDLGACTRRYHAKCMQSDWMIGGCARYHNVMELRELGCGTCDPRRIKESRYVEGVRQRLRDDRCFFLQQATPVARDLPLARHSGAIVHGLSEPASEEFYRRHNNTAERKSARRGGERREAT